MKISLVNKEKLKNSDFVRISFNEKISEGRLIVAGKNKTLEIMLLPKEKLNWRQTTLIPRQIIFSAKKNGIKKITIDWDEIKALKLGKDKDVAEAFAVNFEMANYEFSK